MAYFKKKPVFMEVFGGTIPKAGRNGWEKRREETESLTPGESMI